MQRVDYTPKAPTVGAPTICPACSSTDLGTTSKTIDEATYWRCRTCGEVWNVGRRREVERWPYRR